MTWSGTFHFGDTYAAYFGPSDENDQHQHAAYQIVLSSEQEASIIDELGVEWRGSRLLIRPLVPHAVTSEAELTLLYLDPQSKLALDLADHAAPHDIAELPEAVLPFHSDADPMSILAVLKEFATPPAASLDKRLIGALGDLAMNPGTLSVSEAAQRYGISDGRLRTLAREQFGVPISTWLIWRKLERASRELVAGAPLADAAQAGGFSDQAHFSRTMRRMFGVTPKSAMHSLNRIDH